MIKIGITGNIGSGKTTVCKLFEERGVPVYYADQKAKDLMANSGELQEEIMDEFGKDIYPEGELDRQKLAERVFSNERSLKKLNSLVHPLVFEDLKSWVSQMEKDGHPLILEEAALTFEAGHSEYFDRIFTVVAPEHMLIERVQKRDNTSTEEVKKRLQRQWPQKKKAIQSDAVILNDREHSLIFQVQNLIVRWELPIGEDNNK